MALIDNIVAYWKLESNSNDSVNSNNGSDTAITYSSGNGKIGNGAGFNGTTSKILVPDSTSWTMGNGDFSVSFWVKRTISGALELLCGQSDNAGLNTSISFLVRFNADNTVRGSAAFSSTLVNCESVGTISDTNWHHIVFVRDTGSALLRLYIDNAADGTVFFSNANNLNDSTNSMGIGCVGDFASLFLAGSMDEVGIWKGKCLSPTEVSLLYNGGNGLQYSFLERSGNFLNFF